MSVVFCSFMYFDTAACRNKDSPTVVFTTSPFAGLKTLLILCPNMSIPYCARQACLHFIYFFLKISLNSAAGARQSQSCTIGSFHHHETHTQHACMDEQLCEHGRWIAIGLRSVPHFRCRHIHTSVTMEPCLNLNSCCCKVSHHWQKSGIRPPALSNMVSLLRIGTCALKMGSTDTESSRIEWVYLSPFYTISEWRTWGAKRWRYRSDMCVDGWINTSVGNKTELNGLVGTEQKHTPETKIEQVWVCPAKSHSFNGTEENLRIPQLIIVHRMWLW